ncbi:glycerol-3-phosphate phosphatase-like [Leptopilina boulardi]|uniref:glycerol-3-phosphate phosphatase-like n=1 Tax=Leptopilina boulardi TaxID=63433 RepID=UPI0021F69C40|nr:glycerol-3-phosphate phosphatase-like [Leptopilina boulardi]
MSATYLKSLNNEKLREFLDSFDTVLTDCDGVLWIHLTKLHNASEVMNTFRDVGKRVFYVTNNSTKTRKEFAAKCDNMNFIAQEEDILCTAQLVARYVKDLELKGKIYVVGSEAIGKELKSIGIESFGWGSDSLNCLSDILNIKTEPNVDAVIVGFDEHISYPKMAKAATYLRNEKIHFIGTNTDENFPSETIVCPGTGAIIKAIETCSGRKATVIGKPETYMSSVIKKDYKINPERTLMIGDRANTDILLGTRCGFKTLLVLTGVTSIEELEKWQKSDSKEEKTWIPDYYTDQLGDLLSMLEKYKTEKSD